MSVRQDIEALIAALDAMRAEIAALNARIDAMDYRQRHPFRAHDDPPCRNPRPPTG